MTTKAWIIATLLSFGPLAVLSEATPFNYKPANGYVPDEQTAIAIAVAVWIPIYGEQNIEKEKPYKAVLNGKVWIVEGTLHHQKGGVALAEISKEDGRIMRVSHGK